MQPEPQDPTSESDSLDALDQEAPELSSDEPSDSDPDAEESSEPTVQEDFALQGSPHATATNAALRALSRTARSFLIYDSHNEAIRQFLAEYERAMRKALDFGTVSLGVRPFGSSSAPPLSGPPPGWLLPSPARSSA